jgi:hypothetical protein
LHGWCNAVTTADAVCSWGGGHFGLQSLQTDSLDGAQRTLHEASVAISLVSNPPFSKVLIKICCSAFSCGAMIADTKALTLAVEKEEGLMGQGKPLIQPLRLAAVPSKYNRQGVHSHKCLEMALLKIIN